MRMWNVPPQIMCLKHLLGEHVECHMFVGCIKKKKSIKGYIKNNLVVVQELNKRHDELAKEMTKRGFKHQSPLPRFNKFIAGEIDSTKNIFELIQRCKECQKLTIIYYNNINGKYNF